MTYNLNNIIDYNFYPIPETLRSNMRHRPIGIGVQGLANVFYEMKTPFGSELSKEINSKIFESIYYGALEASMELAKEREIKMNIIKSGVYNEKFVSEVEIEDMKKGLKVIPEELDRDEYLGTYSSYIGSQVYNGKLQFDLWDGNINDDLFNWKDLRKEIKKYGIRNSLLVAPMPTASTSQILGNYECIEPVISNIYTRRVLAGEFMVINEYLVKDLIELDIWNQTINMNLLMSYKILKVRLIYY